MDDELNWGIIMTGVEYVWNYLNKNKIDFSKVNTILIDEPFCISNDGTYHEDLRSYIETINPTGIRIFKGNRNSLHSLNVVGIIQAITIRGYNKHSAGITTYDGKVFSPKCIKYDLEPLIATQVRVMEIINNVFEKVTKHQDINFIINCSWSVSADACLKDYFEKLRNLKNVLLVAAVSDRMELQYPEDLDFSLKVGGIDWTSKIIYPVFSSKQCIVDIYAPGADIKTLSLTEGKFTSDYCNGTSIAAAFVTGIATLIWSINPKLSSTALRNKLIDCGTKIKHGGLTCSIINAKKVLDSLTNETQ